MSRTLTSILPTSFPEQDGIRFFMTVWVVCYHTVWFSAMYMNRDDFDAMYFSKYFFPVNFGLNAVDVFFVLTGFLLAYPVFVKQRSDSWLNFVWCRVTRIYPTFLVSLLFFCVVLHNWGTQPVISWTQHLSPGCKDLVSMVNTDIGEGLSSQCFSSWPNLLFLNNMVPFGGCMGWTWSLCVQVFFYYTFPLVLRIFGTGPKLAQFIIALLCFTVVQRYLLFIYVMKDHVASSMYLWDVKDVTSFFLYFNVWYSSTFQRLYAIFAGVLVAWVYIHKPEYKEKLQSSMITQIGIFAIITYGAYRGLLHDMSSVSQMVLFGGTAPYHVLTVCIVIYCILNNISFFAYIRQFLSLPIFSYLSIPTYAVYLVHGGIITRMYSNGYLTVPSVDTIGIAYFNCLVILCLSFLYGYIVYNLVEKPSKGFLRSIQFFKPKEDQSTNNKLLSSKTD